LLVSKLTAEKAVVLDELEESRTKDQAFAFGLVSQDGVDEPLSVAGGFAGN
jgi:hypothetical protein